MNRGFLIGAVVATGAVMLIPGVAQALGRAGRPLARAGLKSGAYAYKEFQKAGAEVYEHIEDLAAEVRAEFDKETGGTEAPEEWEAEVTEIEVRGPGAAPSGNG